MLWILLFSTIVGSYLLGSIPSGFLVGRARGVDLRKEGSGNIGATNALRVLGKKCGYLVFAADAFKGFVATAGTVEIVERIAPSYAIPMGVVAAAFCVVGHNFPVWLGFQGGKGIATSAGVMLGLFPIMVFVSGLAVWAILFFTTRYVSVASIGAAITLPTASAVLTLMGHCDWLRVSVAGVLCIMAVWRHRPNIQRLLAGTEKKFEKKRATAQT